MEVNGVRRKEEGGDVNGFYVLFFVLVGIFASAVFQVLAYKMYGATYEQALYKKPMFFGCLLFFISSYLSERKSARARKISRLMYYVCCFLMGVFTSSFLFFVVTGK